MSEEGRNTADIRIALLTEYDGTDFVGFQRQDNGRSVQQTLEEAVEKVYGRFCRIYGCSRTDSGVHARGHVSHVDVPFSIPEEKIPLALNAVLDDDLVVLSAKEMTIEFHARFNSKGKRYCYRVRNAKVPSAIDRRTEAFVPGILDVEAMDDAAKAFIISTENCRAITLRRAHALNIDVITLNDLNNLGRTAEGQKLSAELTSGTLRILQRISAAMPDEVNQLMMLLTLVK